MVKKQEQLEGSDVEFVRCASSQIVESANPAGIWSSLGELGERNSAVKKEGVFFHDPEFAMYWLSKKLFILFSFP